MDNVTSRRFFAPFLMVFLLFCGLSSLTGCGSSSNGNLGNVVATPTPLPSGFPTGLPTATPTPGTTPTPLPSATPTPGTSPSPTPTPTPTAFAQVRVIHASPNAPNVDILIDDQIVITNLAYGAASNYLTVGAGSRRIRVRQAGTQTNVFTGTYDVPANTTLTVLATGRTTNLELQIGIDDLSTPPNNLVRLVMYNALPTTGDLDIYITNPGEDIRGLMPNFSNIAFRSASAIFTTPPGDLRVAFTRAGTKTIVADTGTVNVVSGKTRTIIALGDPDVGRPFSTLFVQDN